MSLRSHSHLAIGILAGVLAFQCWAQPAGAITCQKILTARELQAMERDLAGVYCLANDIDAGKIKFAPVGNLTHPFTGRLDGKGHIIKNLKISDSGATVGLFGVIYGAVIQDVSLVDAEIIGTGTVAKVGGLAGVSGNSTILRVSVSGDVQGGDQHWVGGIAGSNYSVITHAFSAARVSGGIASLVGGVAGFNVGMVGLSCAVGPVTGGDSDFQGASAIVGGLVGFNGSAVYQSCAAGPVTVGDGGEAGGLIGHSNANVLGAAVDQNYAIGPVWAGVNASGGGLIGIDGAPFGESYAAGVVDGKAGSHLGGLVGSLSPGGGDPPIVTNSYWDRLTSGRSSSAGGLGTSLRTDELRAALPAGFGSAWAMVSNFSYPYLADTGFDFVCPLATVLSGIPSHIFLLLPVSQLDAAQYQDPPAHADADHASLAAVYTMIARAIGVSDGLSQLSSMKIDTYFWDDANQRATWTGPVTGHARLGKANTRIRNLSGVVDWLEKQKPVILRGIYNNGGLTARHWMLATLFTTDSKGAPAAIIADDPWTGRQVRINLVTRQVASPNFPLAGFTVNGWQAVTTLN